MDITFYFTIGIFGYIIYAFLRMRLVAYRNYLRNLDHEQKKIATLQSKSQPHAR